MASTKISIQANPRKSFFINMLTRDINLEDCIFDLIDNSIDSILDKTKFDPMKGLLGVEKKKLNKYTIAIKFDKNEFSIEDNSSGVGVKEVEEKVFRFGSETNIKRKIGLSVYGIGMKRAFFKIGKLIEFKSNTNKGGVFVKFDVDEWVSNEDEWGLVGETNKSTKKQSLGTKIVIKRINDEVVSNFTGKSFETRFIEKLQTTYGIFLDGGLVIKVNGKKANGKIPIFSTSKKVKVSSKLLKKDGVETRIIAGITAVDDKKSNGWFIFCNGRMILEGDKTSNTGWGNGLLRQFHPSTNRFLGVVYFKSDNVELLPWTTTKNGVNFESTIYQHALGHMVTLAKPIVSFLVSHYSADKNMKGVDSLLEATTDTPISELKKTNTVFEAKIERIPGTEGKVIYTVPTKDIKRVKKIMRKNNISNSEIGKVTFYYYIEQEE